MIVTQPHRMTVPLESILTHTFRFSYEAGECGGIVFSFSKEDAYKKVVDYLIFREYGDSESDFFEGQDSVQVWPVEDDYYFCHEHPQIVDAY